MSHQAVTWAYEQDVKPSGAKFVLVTLANYANGDGYCYPGQASLATDTGMTERAVRGHLERLEADGIILRRHRYGPNGRRTSDEFWLVGFRPLPEDVAASGAPLPEDVAASLPEESAASEAPLPEKNAATTGKKRSHYRKNLPVYIRNLNRQIEPSGEPSDSAPAKPARQRDALFEVIAECWKGVPYGQIRLTKQQRGVINMAASELRAIGVEPAEVPGEWTLLRQRFDNPTPAALVKHWGTNGTGPKRDSRRETLLDGAERRIIAREQSRRADYDAGDGDERPALDVGERAAALDWDVPRLPDPRPWRDA